MAKRGFVCLAACAFVMGLECRPVSAQEDSRPDATDSRPVEITPFVSLGSYGASRVGAAIAFALTSNLSVEAELGYRSEEIQALSTSLNLLYTLPSMGRVTPYLTAGVGLAQHGVPIETASGIFSQRKTAFTVNAGGGVNVRVDDRWSLRTDARWANSVGRDGPESLRLYHGLTFRR
jgi:hypothetical protein